MRTINVSDFTMTPGLRHVATSEKSGEEFYHERLNPEFGQAIKAKEKLTVVLDGTRGYPPSFLDEAFGNLVYDFGLNRVKKGIVIISNVEPNWIPYIEEKYREWEERRTTKKNPRKVTAKHQPWFGYQGDKLERREWTSLT
jgi:hypothetical protein